jgi:hypothetical protein
MALLLLELELEKRVQLELLELEPMEPLEHRHL